MTSDLIAYLYLCTDGDVGGGGATLLFLTGRKALWPSPGNAPMPSGKEVKASNDNDHRDDHIESEQPSAQDSSQPPRTRPAAQSQRKGSTGVRN